MKLTFPIADVILMVRRDNLTLAGCKAATSESGGFFMPIINAPTSMVGWLQYRKAVGLSKASVNLPAAIRRFLTETLETIYV